MEKTTDAPVIKQRFYKVQDIQKLFGIGKNNALSLMRSTGFPAIKIGKTYFVDSEKLEDWIRESYGKEIPLSSSSGKE